MQAVYITEVMPQLNSWGTDCWERCASQPEDLLNLGSGKLLMVAS